MWIYEETIMAIYRRPKQMKLKENLYAQPGDFFYEDGTPFEGFYHMFDKRNKQYFENNLFFLMTQIILTIMKPKKLKTTSHLRQK